jgi:hypothetical protein
VTFHGILIVSQGLGEGYVVRAMFICPTHFAMGVISAYCCAECLHEFFPDAKKGIRIGEISIQPKSEQKF